MENPTPISRTTRSASLYSPLLDIAGMPVQPVGAIGIVGLVEGHPELVPGCRCWSCRVTGKTVRLGNADILDGTPVLDVKPCVPRFDVWATARTGWFSSKAQQADTARYDDRFR